MHWPFTALGGLGGVTLSFSSLPLRTGLIVPTREKKGVLRLNHLIIYVTQFRAGLKTGTKTTDLYYY